MHTCIGQRENVEEWEGRIKESVYLLGIPTIGYGLVLIVFKRYVPQKTIWNILNNMPLQRKATSPLVLLPILHGFVKINRTHHLSQTNELPTGVDLKEQNSNLLKLKPTELINWKTPLITGTTPILTEKNRNTGQLPGFSLAC